MKVASLVAAFLDGQLHAVRYVKTSVLGYCGIPSSESPIGIYYVPNWAFDGRTKHGDVDVCVSCSAALCALAEAR